MGSATCILSDVGISCGDRVMCIILREHGSDWIPVSTLLSGRYDNYGHVTLDEEPTGLLTHLRGWVVPREGGNPLANQQPLNPDDLDWQGVEEAAHRRWLHLFGDDNARDHAVEAAIRRRAGIVEQDEDVFWHLQATLTRAGLASASYTPDSLRVCGSGLTNVYVVTTPFGTTASSPLVARAQDLLAQEGYTAHLVPAPERAYLPGTPPDAYQVALLVTPSLRSTTRAISFSSPRHPPQVRAHIGLIRADVLDALLPVDPSTTRRAEALQAFIAQRRDPPETTGFWSPHVTTSWMEAKLDLRFTPAGRYTGAHHAAEQILALPPNTSVEALVPWVQLSDLIEAAHGWMRRGLRPTPSGVGSLTAADDWKRQAQAHRAVAKVITTAIRERRKR